MGASLRDSARQALLWSAGLNLFRDLLQFFQMLVMVRLLDPAIYGMAGLATTVVNFIGIVSFQHVVVHVLQVRDDRQVDYHQHFTAGVAINGLLFVVANVVALGVRLTAQYVHLQPLIHLLSLTFLLSVPVDLRVKMLERAQDWRRLRTLQMAGIVVSVASGIGMALAGAGVYALVAPGLLAASVTIADLFLVCGWRPRWRWRYAGYRDTLRFGLDRVGSNALGGGRALLQNGLIAQQFQFSSLGVFGRAEGLANMFCGRVAQETGNALYPVITRAEARSERFQRISRLVLQSVVWLVVPVAAVFSLEAEGIVRVVYGGKWLGVVPLLPLAMFGGLAVSVGATAYRLLLANDQSRLCLRSDVAAFFLSAAAMLVLLPLGLRAYLVGALVVNTAVAVTLVCLLIASRGLAPASLKQILVPPAVAAGIVALVALALGAAVPAGLPAPARTLLAGAVLTGVYVVVLRTMFRAALAEIVGFLPGGRRIGSLLLL